ncbi:hypothetical protein [Lysinibacillus sp. Bpr_S20]|uniref:hypothetical protein n=1 Tax=Lysinibacillus sp. Bpr_S20 TaxID=2933964 RepID=UPI0020115DDE|nr:hypothetical protein [Lysinibacillus sp. Bpr_S20]MCL1702672.1 hypothetical protein [Lysinibacillus sp. Bpr_S20]
MYFKLFKKNLAIIIAFLLLLLMGCEIPKKDVEENVKNHLENYGIKDYNILSAKNDGERGESKYGYVEIYKPYHVNLKLAFNRGTNQFIPDESDDVYLQLFKEAYIQQHPELIKASNQIIEKYHLMDGPSKNYYLDFNIEKDQKKRLIDDLRKKEKIDTNSLLPSLTSDENESLYPLNNESVINFHYIFNVYENNNTIPKASDILNDFKESKVLCEGKYFLNIQVVSYKQNSVTSLGEDYPENNILFVVGKDGKFRDIRTLKRTGWLKYTVVPFP